MLPNLLRRFTRDTFVLARHCEAPDGRRFEEAVRDLARLLGCWIYQGPGSLNLFGTRSVSGNRHELDLGMLGTGMLGIAEAKSRGSGVAKADVMVFVQKTFDYYVARLREGRRGPTWRLFISATPVPDPISVYCMQQGVILVEPTTLPLPMLLHFVAQPEAEQVFDDVRLAEAVRLFEPACLPMERIFVPHSDGLHLGLGRFFGQDAKDARWLATQMTTDLLLHLEEKGRDPFMERARVLARLGTLALSRALATTRAG